MKKIVAMLLMSLFLLSACDAMGTKVAVVDVNAVLAKSPHAQKADAEANLVQEIYQYNLTVIEKKLEKYKNKELAANYLAQAAQQLQQQLELSRLGISQAMAKTLSETITAKSSAYDLVLTKNGTWLAGKEHVDISAQIQPAYDAATVEFPPRPQRIDEPNLPEEETAEQEKQEKQGKNGEKAQKKQKK